MGLKEELTAGTPKWSFGRWCYSSNRIHIGIFEISWCSILVFWKVRPSKYWMNECLSPRILGVQELERQCWANSTQRHGQAISHTLRCGNSSSPLLTAWPICLEGPALEFLKTAHLESSIWTTTICGGTFRNLQTLSFWEKQREWKCLSELRGIIAPSTSSAFEAPFPHKRWNHLRKPDACYANSPTLPKPWGLRIENHHVCENQQHCLINIKKMLKCGTVKIIFLLMPCMSHPWPSEGNWTHFASLASSSDGEDSSRFSLVDMLELLAFRNVTITIWVSLTVI